jgi:hemerythrin-like domain-containing protein
MAGVIEPKRRLLVTAGIAGAGLLLSTSGIGCAFAAEKGKKHGQEKEVGAVEDLMREHGVLRQALLVYIESVSKLRADPGSIPGDPIAQTAKLFRSFGEDYHERMLEEAYIFPALKKAGGPPAAAYVDVLKSHHDRGREITDYILTVTGKGSIGSGDAEPLARPFETLVLMYQNHTAREDTVVFPAWKDALSERQLREMANGSKTLSTSNLVRMVMRMPSNRSRRSNRCSALLTSRSSPLLPRRKGEPAGIPNSAAKRSCALVDTTARLLHSLFAF